jgi:Tol biopolymer transport system component
MRDRSGILTLAFTATVAGCGGDGTGPLVLPESRIGTLQVFIRTTGVEMSPRGYTLIVGDTPGITTDVNDSVTLSFPAGSLTLLLRDVPVTCDPETGVRTSDGTVTLTETVRAGEVREVTFEIVCTGKDIVFARVATANVHELFRINPDGSGEVRLTFDAGPVLWHPRWSPDGSRIAYASDAVSSTNVEIFLVEADGSQTDLLCCGGDPEDLAWDLNPAWSPDGGMIVWSAVRPDTLQRGIHRINVDGTGVTRLTTGRDDHPDWGPDGRILFTRVVRDPPNEGDLYVMSASGEDMTLLVEGVEDGGSWSPDGRTIAFTRRESGARTSTIWTVPASGGVATRRPGELLEVHPRWSPDGADLVFHYGAGEVLSTATRGICVGAASGSSCLRLTAVEPGGLTMDLYPDWRRRLPGEAAATEAEPGPRAARLTGRFDGR